MYTGVLFADLRGFTSRTERIDSQAAAALLRRFPEHRGRVTLLQVAPVSRGDVVQYRALRRELDELAGRINGEHGDIDWVPVRWMTRAVPRATLAGFHRLARVGLVTPMRDGMNLVAKEFVAAQDEADPGALVLSCFAGAAEELFALDDLGFVVLGVGDGNRGLVGEGFDKPGGAFVKAVGALAFKVDDADDLLFVADGGDQLGAGAGQ